MTEDQTKTIKQKCPKCESEDTIKAGKDWKGNQRYACKSCKKMFFIKSGV